MSSNQEKGPGEDRCLYSVPWPRTVHPFQFYYLPWYGVALFILICGGPPSVSPGLPWVLFFSLFILFFLHPFSSSPGAKAVALLIPISLSLSLSLSRPFAVKPTIFNNAA
ncbi:hypothetical protein I7I48_01488 [Histoplasma ohiense]|nr:hypothetical protein I7I48_01488 [Histoplasma ohiense (nom. inval.)]